MYLERTGVREKNDVWLRNNRASSSIHVASCLAHSTNAKIQTGDNHNEQRKAEADRDYHND